MAYTFYTVRPGDTLSGLAETWFNNPSHYSLFLNSYGNPIANPDIIFPGQLLVVPLITQYLTYAVQPGDTLSQIAVRFLMRGGLYPLILDENGNKLADPNRIQVGQILRVPNQAEMPRTGLTPHAIANLVYSGQRLFNGNASVHNEDFDAETVTAIEQFSYGDINGLGEFEAAVITSTMTMNTTGRFKKLYAVPSVLRPGDDFYHLLGADLGDRVQTNAVYFGHNALVHVGTGDWPDQEVRQRRFKLFGDANAVGLVPEDDNPDVSAG